MFQPKPIKLLLLLALVFLPFCDGDTNAPDTSGAWLIPKSEIQEGGPGKDGIVALTNPTFIPVSQDNYYLDSDLVIGVRIDNFIRAFPHPILDQHEIVNHTIGNTSFALSYCPLTGSGVAWDTSGFMLDNTFGVSGLLYNSNLIPYDRETDSNWSQMLLLCVNGESIGQEPLLIPVVETTWKTWKELYPDSFVLSHETGFNRNYRVYPYGNYKTSDSLLFSVNNEDSRLHKKERVHGVIVGGETKTYPISIFGSSTKVLNDIFNNLPIVIVGNTTKNFAVSFERELDDKSLHFMPVEDEFPVIMMDSLGTMWDIFGHGVSGPNKGQKLKPTQSFISYWFAWAAFYPNAEIHGSTTQLSHTSFEHKMEDPFSRIQTREFIRSRIGTRLLKEWPTIVKKTKLVPHSVNGVTLGLRFQKFPTNSILSELGIREFDVLKSINGTELKDLSTLSALFTELKNTNRIEVEIERYGRPLTLRYTLK